MQVQTLPVEPYVEGDVGYIPLRRRDGSARAWTMVDAADYRDLSAHRWHLGGGGYVMRHVPHPTRKHPARALLLLHRPLLALDFGDPRQVDHINRDRLDNRRVNLRIVSRAQNGQNRPAIAGTTSRFRGVHWYAASQKWRAIVEIGPRQHYLGVFEDEDDANAAAVAFRREHMPYATD